MAYPNDISSLLHHSVWFEHEIIHKDLLVFCNISARLSRYLVDIRAHTAQYSKKLTCIYPVKLLNSYGFINFDSTSMLL